MKKKQIIIIILFIFLAIFSIIALLFLTNDKNNQTATYEPERGGGSSLIAIKDNQEMLYNSFLPNDLTQVRYAITKALSLDNIDTNIETLVIDDVQTPYREGDETTIFSHIDSTKKMYTFIVKIPSDGSPSTMFVKETNRTYSLLPNDDD